MESSQWTDEELSKWELLEEADDDFGLRRTMRWPLPNGALYCVEMDFSSGQSAHTRSMSIVFVPAHSDETPKVRVRRKRKVQT